MQGRFLQEDLPGRVSQVIFPLCSRSSAKTKIIPNAGNEQKDDSQNDDAEQLRTLTIGHPETPL